MNADDFTRPSFGRVNLANVSESDTGLNYVVQPEEEYDIYISSDDKQVKLQRN